MPVHVKAGDAQRGGLPGDAQGRGPRRGPGHRAEPGRRPDSVRLFGRNPDGRRVLVSPMKSIQQSELNHFTEHQ